MVELTPGGRYRMPNGIPVEAQPAPAGSGVAWELRGPGGWGRWAVDHAGAILALHPARRGRVDLAPTGWAVADLA